MARVASVAAPTFEPEGLAGVPVARGHFDELQIERGSARVRGWMMLPDREYDSARVYVDGRPAATAEKMERPDLTRCFPAVPHAGRSGFSFTLTPVPVPERGLSRVDLVGFGDGRPVMRMGTYFRFRPDLDALLPTPPAALMKRVVGNTSPDYFKLEGQKSFGEFSAALARRRRDWGSVRRLLDWGCGCGRLAAQFRLEAPGPEVYGCDIDGEAVAWCNQNLGRGRFTHIKQWPPTPYPDGHFDVVIGYSVFTHLTRQAQNAWLAEIRRVLVPGGLFLASVHGQFAARSAFGDRAGELLQNGIFDEIEDHALDGIADQGYYRGTYQSREYTFREWSRYFTILEYCESGVSNHQDLVVMQRGKGLKWWRLLARIKSAFRRRAGESAGLPLPTAAKPKRTTAGER